VLALTPYSILSSVYLALMHKNILQIALDVPLDRLFDYLDGGFDVQVGQRVVVPFGARKVVGVVAGITDKSDFAVEKLKSIIQVFDGEPPLDADTFGLLRFCADYYQYPFGQALLASLPTRLRQIEPAVSRKQFLYALSPEGLQANIDEIPARQSVQRKIFTALLCGALTESALKETSASWRPAIEAFQEKGWITAEQVLAGFKSSNAPVPPPQLNEEQTFAVKQVTESANTFKPFLLHGITGSGKTEVYMQILQQILADPDSQALVLVPEINLTPQLEARFRNRLPHFPLVSLHSNLSESERLQNWRLAQSGQARIIIGTRLAVFTPIPNLKVVLVDEEHDGSYKQQDSMRYHARDVAMVQAQRNKVPIVMGSATPALESWQNAQTNKYTLLSLNARAVAQSALPNIRCLDTTKLESTNGLTPVLVNAMRERLERGEQSLLFINRRGYSPVLLCSACHWIAPCMRCSSRLVGHLKQGRLR
jgi:primosomal protein N' (replication factor Y)